MAHPRRPLPSTSWASRNVFRRAARLRVELVERRSRPGPPRSPPESERVASRAGERNRDQLQDAGCPPGAQVAPPAALRAGEEVVGQARGSDGADAERRRPGCAQAGRRDRPSDDRQPVAAVVERQRARREDGVDELTAPVCEPCRIAARGAMAKRQLHLADPQAGPGRVDRHAQLAAEAACKRKARGARSLAQIALPGQRLPQAKP